MNRATIPTNSRERANLLHELIERVDFDGRGQEVGLTFRATGAATLAYPAQGRAA